MKAIEIINLLNKWVPSYLVDDWDNTGFQIGDPEKEVKNILLSLDLDREVLEKALDKKVDMIITHHPIIFKPLKSITKTTYKEKLIYNIIREDIVVYNAHTNLDLTTDGVNDALANILTIKNTEPLKIVHKETENDIYLLNNSETIYGYGRIGEIKKMPLLNFLDNVKERLKTDYLTVYGDLDKEIKRVAVCGGSGSSFIYDAYSKGADIYITGDIKYHEAQYANELGLTIVDAGHYHTEKVVLPVIKKHIEENTQDSISIELYNKSSPSYIVY